MTLRRRLELESNVIKKQIENRALFYMEKHLGKENQENRQARNVQGQEILQLIRENEQYLMPEGIYTISSSKEFMPKGIDKRLIQSESIIALCCKEFESSSVTERFLMHLLQVSYMNSVRDYIRELVIPAIYQMNWKEKANYVTQYYGPGFFDMPLEELEKMCGYAEAETIGITCDNGILKPAISFVGALYVTKEKVEEKMACKDCKAGIGCEYCMKRMR